MAEMKKLGERPAREPWLRAQAGDGRPCTGRSRPLALRSRRWDLFDLLLEWGGDLKSVGVSTVLDTYNVELYERFRAAGYDLTERHEMASMLGHSTRNRPLLGFVKRHRSEDPKIQQELNIALGCHARAGNEGGVSLCLWAGADPHAPAPWTTDALSSRPQRHGIMSIGARWKLSAR